MMRGSANQRRRKMEVNWKEFWKNYWSFTKKVEAEESAVADIITFLLFFSGSCFVIYGFVVGIAWAFGTGLLGLVIGAAIFRLNTALARCKVAEKMDNDRQ